jgi:hypothetical protein
MYLKIKYNAFYKHIINDSTTEITTCKNESVFGQREVIYFFKVSTSKGE